MVDCSQDVLDENIDDKLIEVSRIRVNVSVLDKLQDLVGELVLVRDQFLKYSSRKDESRLEEIRQKLDLVTDELQAEVIKTRMQPIGSILFKFKRVIRDLSAELGKKVNLNLLGTETELDKALLEAIKDPLTHIVRNSIDHGLETVQDRRAAGKPEVGELTIRAFHEGSQINIEIKDDGRGINSERVIQQALEKRIVTEEQLHNMTDREINNLIFQPGLSTAESVTTISGRGVGMDVVKTNIESIGGSIELDSVLGTETTLRLKIPLALGTFLI